MASNGLDSNLGSTPPLSTLLSAVVTTSQTSETTTPAASADSHNASHGPTYFRPHLQHPSKPPFPNQLQHCSRTTPMSTHKHSTK
ncbi:hypothetical protein NL676_033902 [Syzygium grande]|nr:hypothetical protein NL676_033902 [Syzygium grande]